MVNAIHIEAPQELERFSVLQGLSNITPGQVQRSGADAHWVVDDSGGMQARCSLWWSTAPQLPGQRVGILGHYAARTIEAARSLLQTACTELARQGCTLAVGPMDGSTNRRYRLLTERGTEPPFFLEPDNPDDWPEHFTSSGFAPLTSYYSALQEKLDQEDPRVSTLAKRFAAEGVILRSLDVSHFEDELHRIYRVVDTSFRDNFLASPISYVDFLEQYRPLLSYVRSELVLLAEREEETVGFIFTLPDWCQATINTVIVKTLAVHPAYSGHGLGTLLIGRSLEIAYGLGYTRAIHALMHEQNISRSISQAIRGKIMRRYTLYAKTLEG